MSKAISKLTVYCPHCGGQQPEPALAKSTFCRKCSEYFAITPATLSDPIAATSKPSTPTTSSWARPATPVPSDKPLPAASAPQPKAEAAGGGLLSKFEGIFSNKPKVQVAQCFECNAWHEVSSTAQSSTCKACGAYIDLQDYKVSGSFSRNIKTRGTVYLGSKGDLSSSKIICSHATIHGKMRGNLTCSGKVTIRVHGKLFGSVEAGELIVEKGSEVIFTRPVHTQTAEIHGHMSGQIVAHGNVDISRSGFLAGAISASCFNVEKGGSFQGELTISPRQQPNLVSATPIAGTASPAREAGLDVTNPSPVLG